MNCSDIERILNEENIATLGVAERAAVQNHIAACAACTLEWQAYQRYATAAVPQLPDDVLARCRARFVAAARAQAVRTATRPLLLVGLFLGAAAAALVGSQLFDGNAGRGDIVAEQQLATPIAPLTTSLDSPALDVPGVFSEATVSSTVSARTAAAAAPPEPSSVTRGGFVLAVSELQRERVAGAALPFVNAVYEQVVQELRAIPSISVVAVGLDGTRGAISPTEPAVVDLSFVPSALRDRMQAVAVGPSAADGPGALTGVLQTSTMNSFELDANGGIRELPRSPINIILNSNIRGTRLDAPVSGGAAGYRGGAVGAGDSNASSAPSDARAAEDFDYRLDFEATSAVRNGSLEWTLSYRGSGSAALPRSVSFSSILAGGADVSSVVRSIVDHLRLELLPADPTWLADLRSRVLDARLPRQARLEALSTLRDLDERTGAGSRDDTVVQAAVELATTATDLSERAHVWQLLRGARNEIAVAALASSLMTDHASPAQLEALRTLAADFPTDPAARAALEQAALDGATPTMRLQATWAVRDTSERNLLVREALLDWRISDDERLAPLRFALEQQPAAEYYVGGIDDAAAAALLSIVERASIERKRGLLAQFANVAHEGLTEAYIDFLRDAENEATKVLAVSMLGRRPLSPRVHAALESVRYDDSPHVRDAVARVLAKR